MKSFPRVLFFLVLLVLSLSVFSVASAEAYPVWINNVQFTSEKTTIPCGDGTATLTKDAANSFTLTLTDATISTLSQKRSQHGIYSAQDLTVVLKGTNTIKVNADGIAGLFAEKKLTLIGDGSLTIETNRNSMGIATGTDTTYFKMEGALTIRGGKRGISARAFAIFFSQTGDIEITGAEDAIFFEIGVSKVLFDGTGNINLSGTNYGIRLFGESMLSLKGSGAATITGGNCGIFCSGLGDHEECTIRLNGVNSPVTISAINGDQATKCCYITGDNIKNYSITGKPGGKTVVYKYYMDLPPTGDPATPLLWSLLATLSCSAIFMLMKTRKSQS